MRSSRLAPGLLTPAERRVVTLMVDGFTSPEIARKLGLTEFTVKSHLHNVAARWGTRNRVQTALAAVRYGVVAVPDAPVDKPMWDGTLRQLRSILGLRPSTAPLDEQAHEILGAATALVTALTRRGEQVSDG